jgi:hypothetical protein
VSRVFGPTRAWIVCEIPDPDGRLQPPGERTEGADHPGANGSSPRWAVRAAGSGLNAALGYATARDRLGQDHWVVAILDARSLAAVQGPVGGWATLPSRFLAINVQSSEPRNGRAEQVSETLRPCLAARGGKLHDLSAGYNERRLGALLQTIRGGDSPAVILAAVDGALDAMPAADHLDVVLDPPSGPQTRDTAPAQLLLSGLVRCLRRDRRLSLVDATDDPLWNALPVDGQQVLRIGRGLLGEALPWCGALAQAGCHPVLVLDVDEFLAHRPALASELCTHGRSSTLVVLERAATRGPLAGGLLAGEGLLPYLPGAGLRVIAGESDVAAGLQHAFGADQATILYCPANSVLPADGRQGVRAAVAAIAADIGRAQHDAVRLRSLSADFQSWADRYAQIGRGHRGQYLWQWCLHGLEAITLSCVEPSLVATLCDTKLMAVMYGVLLDDVADCDRDAAFLGRLTLASKDAALRNFSDLAPQRRAYAEFTCTLWDAWRERIAVCPRSADFTELLDYDSDQVLNTLRYSYLVNADLRLINIAEHDLYSPHNMQMMTFATTDLMCSPGFDPAELGALRQAVWHAQCMGRIGNLVSTWERELTDGDFTSGVFARLREAGRAAGREPAFDNHDAIRTAVRAGNVEDYFLRQWTEHRRCVQAMVPQVRSVDLRRLLSGLDRLIHMELASRGLK